MSEQLLNVIKKAAKDVIEETTPSTVMFGTVTNINPLTINVEQKLPLTSEFLVLTKNVVDYTVDVTIDWTTESRKLDANHGHDTNVSGDCSVTVAEKDINLTHNHNITGTKKITIHNGLKNGDKVILLRQAGGQKYVVLDKSY